jgi:cell division protein FtsW
MSEQEERSAEARRPSRRSARPDRPTGSGEGPRAAAARLPDSTDPVLLGAVLLLVAVGLVFVYSASAVRQAAQGDEFHNLHRQLLAAGLGLGLLVVAVRLGTERLARLAYPIMGATVVLLALVPLLGKTAGGAQRWIPLGPLNLQPAELAKVALVLYLARSLARKREKVRLFSIGLLPHLVVTAVVAWLCLLQRDLGTGVILFAILLAMLFVAGARVAYLLGAAAAALPVLYHYVLGVEWRRNRVLAFLDPERYKDERFGQQLWESLSVISNGGWFGQGLGQGRTRFFHLPAPDTDFIAASIAEQAGFLGLALVIGLFAVVVWRGLRAARRATDAFGCYAAVGLTTLVGGQALFNLAVVLGMVPTKGLTLPFVSYGGSSLLSLLGGAGVLLAVSAERGGFLSRAPGAVRVARHAHGELATGSTVPRHGTARAEEAP